MSEKNVTIRLETKEDYRAVENLTREALPAILTFTASLALFRPKPRACAMPMTQRRTIFLLENCPPDFWTVSPALTKILRGILSVRKILRGLNGLKPPSR